MSNPIVAVRACGTREKTGIYWELGLSKDGAPVEDFLMDPPYPIDPAAIAKRGVTPFERDGVTHLIDWVGEAFYPNVADFIEEVRALGLSRRLPAQFDYSRLTTESRLILAHARALVMNEEDQRHQIEGGFHQCIRKKKEHEMGVAPHCASVAWLVVEGGEPIESVNELSAREAFLAGGSIGPEVAEQGHRLVRRRLPSFTFAALAPAAPPVWRAGVFASFPASRLVIVNDAGRPKEIEQRLAAVDAANLPVALVDA